MPIPLILDALLPAAKSQNFFSLFKNELIGRKGTTVYSDSTVTEGNQTPNSLLSENRGFYWRSGSLEDRAAYVTPECRLTFVLAAPRSFDFASYGWSNVLCKWQAEFWVGTPDPGVQHSLSLSYVNATSRIVASDADLSAYLPGATITLGGAATQPGDYTISAIDPAGGYLTVTPSPTTADDTGLDVTITLVSPGELRATTGWVSPVVASEPADFLPDDFPFAMCPSEERLLELAADMRMASFYQLAAPVYGITHVRFRFDVADGVNGIRDFLQIGLCFGGVLFQPFHNMSLGASIIPVDRSIKRRTATGASVGLQRAINSEISIALPWLSDDEAVQQIYLEWLKREGSFARAFVSKENAPKKRRLFYDGGAFVGVLESIDAVEIDSHEGDAGGLVVAKSVKGIRIQETE